MMDADDRTSAEEAAATLTDSRATYFHDPQHVAGLEIARSLGWQHHVAWDAYLFYGPAARWDGDTLPAPSQWFHELLDREVWEEQADTVEGSSEWTSKLAQRSEADPDRFSTGDDLVCALRETVETLAP